MLKRRNSESGDTIVEVLICILVISSVLAGAFVVTNKSLQSVRDSQERAQALKIAESQLEGIRIAGGSGTFCLDNDLVAVPITGNSRYCYFNSDGQIQNPTGSVMVSAFESTSGAVNGLFSSGSTVLYQTRVSKDATTGLYTVTVKWVNPKANLSQAQLVYKAGN